MTAGKYSKGPCDLCGDATILAKVDLFDMNLELCRVCCVEIVNYITKVLQKQRKRHAVLEYEARQLESEEVDIE